MQINNTKNKIMDVCIELFAEKTYDTVSLREIARKVGIKESTVYSHYSSKQEILEKIVELQINGHDEHVAQLDRLQLELKENVMNYKEILHEFMNVTKSPQFIKITRIVFKESFSNPILKDAKAQQHRAAKVVDILIYELINQNIIKPKYEDIMSKSIHGYDKALLVEYLSQCTEISETELIALYDEYINRSIEFIDQQVQLFKKISELDI